MAREPLSSELRRLAKISVVDAIINAISSGNSVESLQMLQLDQPKEQLQLYLDYLYAQGGKVIDDEFEEVDMGDDAPPGLPNQDTAEKAKNSPLIQFFKDTLSVREPGIDPSLIERLETITGTRIDLGEQFLAAAEEAESEQLELLVARGVPINYHDPRNGATALHYVAAQGARPAFRVLMKTGKCDFLARDNEGRLASEMAGAHGRDLVMERLLLMKEIRQARQTGVPFHHLYRRNRMTRSPPPSP